MGALLTFEGDPANKCVASGAHDPAPLRFVWHHIQPQEAGGQTTADNLIEICDSCHYTIHRLMWYMRLLWVGETLNLLEQAQLAHPPRRAQLMYADQGYAACVAAGTVSDIPNEG